MGRKSMESKMRSDIKNICDKFKIIPSIINAQLPIKIGNYNGETMNVLVDFKLLAGEIITKDMYDKKVLPENLRIELI